MRHRTLTRTLVVLGTLIALLAIVSLWVSRQALETDEWTETSSELIEDPAVQSAVSGFLVDQLYANVDVAAELREALPERAQPLAGPAAGALRQGAEQITDRALDRPRVQQAWEQANRRAHEVFVKVVEGDGDVVASNQGVVSLDLKALLDEIAARTGVGARAAEKIPEDAAQIEIMRSDQLDAVQSVGNILKPLAAFLVLAMVACYGAAIGLASGRRRETLRGCGFGLIFAGVTALVVRALTGDVVVGELATTAAAEPAAESVWRIGTSMLAGIAGAAIAYGAIVVAGTWLAGPARAATRLREGLAPYLRDARIAYGVVAAVVLLVLLWGPTQGTQRVLPALLLIALLVAGVEALRRQVHREFPDAERGTGRGLVAAVRDIAGRARATTPGRAARGTTDGDETAASQLDDAAIAQLERLAELHRAGGIDDEEFAAAKHRVLTSA